MQNRTPAAAGMFYPRDITQLQNTIKECMLHEYGPGSAPQENGAIGVIVPHAGYMYSGPVACHSFFAIKPRQPKLFIIIGPNHWGLGSDVSSMKNYTWETPLGKIDVNSTAADELSCESDLIQLDPFSHTKEHSIEVQLPMLQEFFSDFAILPISLTSQDKDTAMAVGHAVADVAKKHDAVVLGSSDFTHYEPNEFAHSQDKALIDAVLHLDIDAFYQTMQEKKVTACGYGAIAATMIACMDLGATKCTLLQYATSGDISGNKTSVVGYGSISFN